MFFASDLHGSNVCFKKFINGAQFYGADVLVLGGDLTGKAVIPIAEQADGTFLAFQHGRSVKIDGKSELDEFVKRQGNMGFYPAVMSEAEYQRLKADPEGAGRSVQEACAGARAGMGGARRAKAEGHGNSARRHSRQRRLPRDRCDPDPVAACFDFHEMQVCEFKGGYQMLYCGGSTPTPWDTEREYTEAQYVSRFSELLPQVRDMSRCIFNVHVPPFGTALDACNKLDENLQVVYEMGLPVQTHAGCQTLVRRHQGAPAAAWASRARPRRPRQDQYRQDHLHQSRERLSRRHPAGCHDYASGRRSHASEFDARLREHRSARDIAREGGHNVRYRCWWRQANIPA